MTSTAFGNGEIIAAGSNAPVLLDEVERAWLVMGGAMDVFAVPVRDGNIVGPREFVFHVEPGALLLGCGVDSDSGLTLMAVGGADGSVIPMAIADVRDYVRSHPAVGMELIDQYIRTVSLAFGERSAPRLDVLADDDDELVLKSGGVIGSRRDVVWLSLDHGAVQLLGEPDLAWAPGALPFPLAPGSWLAGDSDLGLGARFSLVSIASLVEREQLWPSVARFQFWLLNWATLVVDQQRKARATQLGARIDADHDAQRDALIALAAILTPGEGRSDRKAGLPLLAAMQMVGDTQGVTFRAPRAGLKVNDVYNAAREIAHSSSVGQRRVKLSAGWWKHDVGPLLGFIEMRSMNFGSSDATGHDIELLPVALLPTKTGTYEIVNTETGSRSQMTDELAQHVAAFGVQFYRGLPSTAVAVRDLWQFATFGVMNDAKLIVSAGFAGAAVGLLMPLVTGYLFDDVIPSADGSALANVFTALVVAAIAAAAFDVTRAVAVIRVHTRIGSAMQMAVLNRLLHLPATFHRQYASGDLGLRALGINTIGKQLGSATLSAVLSSVASAASFFLLFYYSVPLALLATGVVALNMSVTVVVSRLAMRNARAYQKATGKLSGLVLQLLEGVAKIRVSATESRAFAKWSTGFRQQQELAFRVGLFTMHINVLNVMLEILGSLAIFWLYAKLSASPSGGLSTGTFLAFSAAFGTFLAAGAALSQVIVSLVSMVPTWERGKPILETLPEVDAMRPDPGEITGRIEVSHVNFAYSVEGPAILHDVSIDAKPGEFVALVGPSGSGKSTLLRILLGFDTPQAGSVRFDGHELSAVDVGAVRRQIGVVLQSATLTAGDIYSNIVGASSLTLADAWEAARMAGLEGDLHAMPMGMNTIVSEGGGGLSGGQRQRLLIARALVTRPRMLFFDEATSALDNRSQRVVTESVDQLHATRVVVAHRLSTIRHADRIVVLDAGRVVESGNYDELMANDGLFARMAARQEA